MLKRIKTNALASSFKSKGSQDDLSNFKVPIIPWCSIDLHIRLVKNIENGRYLIPDENCNFEAEKLDEIPVEHKSSQYWFSFKDHNNVQIQTKKKSYIEHFQVEEVDSKMVGKADMDFKLRIDEKPSIQLRDWIYQGLMITFWESRPLFAKVKEEGQEQETEKVQVDPKT